MFAGMGLGPIIAECDHPLDDNLGYSGLVYKYMKSEHAAALVNAGMVKIGTLYDFRRESEYGEYVGDRLEGFEYRTDYSPHIRSLEIQGLTLSNVYAIGMGGAPSVAIQYSSRDYFVYCTTKVVDKNAALKAGYDSCVVINDPMAFFGLIKIALDKRFELSPFSFDCRAVAYKPRTALFDTNENILTRDLWCTKDDQDRYMEQQEIRVRWAPKYVGGTKPLPLLDPFLVPELVHYCERLY